ncbi:MAG TPA: outer membrane lipoprotein chaperone LolA [Gammaproteobacteria bacterium]|jgi:outer membrane lipoprotein carrier protein|nr:outer membrane lipoprotein chaperone LolA [Gammaproteobacteria bacterium]
MKLLHCITRSIILIALIAAQPAFAENTATTLSDLLNSTRSMRAHFTQTIFDNHGKAVQRSTGKMAMARPGKFRWEVIKPIPQLIIANEPTLWIYDADLQQVTIRSLKKETGEAPALLLSHVGDQLEKDFTVQNRAATVRERHSSTPTAERWFSLFPKKNDSMFKKIEIGFKENKVYQMRLTDNLGHATLIQFEHIEINIPLPPSLFSFKPPAHVDVIRENQTLQQ